jgi:hypothetical protein
MISEALRRWEKDPSDIALINTIVGMMILEELGNPKNL